jgi:hypothetical protein
VAEHAHGHWRRYQLLTSVSENAEVKIELSLTSDTYQRSLADAPELVVTTTITNADVLTLELRGEQDNGSILEEDFYMDHFTFYDLTTDKEVINTNTFPGTCEPREDLYQNGVVELRPSKSLVTRRDFDDVSPLSDPVRQLENGHEYRTTLKPQEMWCFAGSKHELFGSKKYVPVEDLPEGMMVRLESADELRLKVEA